MNEFLMIEFLYSREFVGVVATVIGIYGYLPYFYGIFKGKTRPHGFSWLVWGLLTGIGWAAQYADGAGPGAWVTLFTAAACFMIAALSLKYGERNITRSDTVTFIAALSAIPLWYFTKDPLWSVVLVTVIDALAFYPTFRKSWHKPHQEVMLTYSLSAVKFGLALIALENTSLVTALYPVSLVIMNGAFVAVMMMRRRALSKTAAVPS